MTCQLAGYENTTKRARKYVATAVVYTNRWWLSASILILFWSCRCSVSRVLVSIALFSFLSQIFNWFHLLFLSLVFFVFPFLSSFFTPNSLACWLVLVCIFLSSLRTRARCVWHCQAKSRFAPFDIIWCISVSYILTTELVSALWRISNRHGVFWV